MPLISTLAGEVSDINPDLASPQDVAQVCRFAQARLNQMLTHGKPMSKAEGQTESLLDEIDTVLQTLSTNEVRNSWKEEKLAHVILGRLAEMEHEAYNIFLASIEELEDGNPLHSLAEAYREALQMKARGEVIGVAVIPGEQE